MLTSVNYCQLLVTVEINGGYNSLIVTDHTFNTQRWWGNGLCYTRLRPTINCPYNVITPVTMVITLDLPQCGIYQCTTHA